MTRGNLSNVLLTGAGNRKASFQFPWLDGVALRDSISPGCLLCWVSLLDMFHRWTICSWNQQLLHVIFPRQTCLAETPHHHGVNICFSPPNNGQFVPVLHGRQLCPGCKARWVRVLRSALAACDLVWKADHSQIHKSEDICGPRHGSCRSRSRDQEMAQESRKPGSGLRRRRWRRSGELCPEDWQR